MVNLVHSINSINTPHDLSPATHLLRIRSHATNHSKTVYTQRAGHPLFAGGRHVRIQRLPRGRSPRRTRNWKGADPVQREGQDDLLLARILKQLGEKEEGHFILVLKRSAVRSIAPTTRIPPNARRSGNNWREVVYQVELIEGRQAAAEFLLAYAAFTQKPNREKQAMTGSWSVVPKTRRRPGRTSRRQKRPPIKKASRTAPAPQRA